MSEEVPIITELFVADILRSITLVLFCFGDCFILLLCFCLHG